MGKGGEDYGYKKLSDGKEGREKEITVFVEPLVIFMILILNAVIGVWQENNAEKALEALKEIQSEHATVISLSLRLVIRVPTDMRVTELISSTLRVEQGSLIGESEAVNKMNKIIGVETKIGKVHKQIYVASQNEEVTPLKKKLNDFVEVLTKMIGVICILYG
ncbi:hypothetical protein WN943_025108 [Citrus x changshan-huyou]